jgi:hypothetical protein
MDLGPLAVVTRNALLDGRRAAVLTALGSNLGVLFWVTAAALGLAAVVAASDVPARRTASGHRQRAIGLGARPALERRP